MTTSTAPAGCRYRELGLLAEGGMAVVTQAVREADGVTVVVKRVRPPLCFDASFVRLFVDEGTVCAAFDHDNIVRLIDRGEDEQGPYLVFEHVDGVDFACLLDQARTAGTPLDVELVLAIAVPLVRALVCVHGICVDGACLDVVHRDISPGNVLLGDDGVVKLADFGIAASRLKSEHTVAGELKGKFAYMAPEQTRGERVTPSADLFALGVVLWEALANRRLFDAATDADVVQQVRHRSVPRLDDVAVRGAAVEAPFADLVAALLAKEPAARPVSASAVLSSLQQIVDARALDDGLVRLVARAVRQAPRRDLTAIAPDVRRQTQRVVGLAGADTILRRPAPTRRGPLVVAGVVVVVVVTVLVAAQTMRSTPSLEVVVDLPELPALPERAAVVGSSLEVTPVPSSTAVVPTPKTPASTTTPKTTTPPKTSAKTSAPAVVADGFGRLSITSEPWAKVSVDGVVVAAETPLMGFTVAAGRHTVVLENPVLKLKRQLVIDVAKDGHERRFVELAGP